MRSVVVVLPASMWAMMPMLRVRDSGYSRTSSPLPPFLVSCSVVATSIFLAGTAIRRSPRCVPHRKPAPGGGSRVALPSPAVVSEGPVRLGHLVDVLAPLDRGAGPVGGVHDLRDESLGHRVLAPRAREVHEPAHRERGAALRLDLDRHLVGRAAHAARLHLEHRADVLDRLLQGDERGVRSLLADLLERAVDDALGGRLLPVEQDPVDQLGHQRVLIDRVWLDRPAYGRALARHLLVAALLRAVTGTALSAVLHARRVERASHDRVPDTTEVLGAAAAHEHDRVLLQVVALAGDVAGHLDAGGEPDAGDLSERRVRLTGRDGEHASADAAPLRGTLQRGGLVLLLLGLATLTHELLDGGHRPSVCTLPLSRSGAHGEYAGQWIRVLCARGAFWALQARPLRLTT